ncbi:MAG: hypothetical protein IKN55_07170 [Oscillospiraceae bacterium]|nr:hypothetical protein [Oscillospiraceae bacterium]
MHICPKCGRQLADGEICHCDAPNQPQSEQPGFSYGQPVPPQYPQGYYYNPQQAPPQKKGLSNGCIIALVIGIISFFFITAILVAILVPAMIGYTRKANYSKSTAQAKTVFNAANSALTELDTRGELEALGRNYIICSEPGSDFNAEGDTATLHQLVEQFIPEDSDGKQWEYFFVVEDNTCVYAAASRTDLNLSGSYPPGSDLRPNRLEGILAPEDWTINDLYTDAVTNLPVYDFGSSDDWDYDDEQEYDWDYQYE